MKTKIAVAFMAIIIAFGFTACGSGDKTAETKKSDKDEVTIVAVGDNIFHDVVIAAGKQDNGEYDYTELYSEIKADVEAADIAIVNQETVLGGPDLPYKGYPVFNTPWEAGEALADAGFDVFTCASNHSMDVGEKGLNGAFEFFENHESIKEVGINKSEEEYNTIDYYEKNGIKFALLNYTYGTNGISLPSGKPWMVNLMDKDKITKDVKEAKENADIVMVFPHWGTEYSTSVSSYQKEYTELFSDLGVDIVIGSHPHVIEKVEWVTNEETDEKMLVYYSLGNFMSNQPDAIMQLGAMAKITVVKEDGKAEVKEASAIPLVTHVEDSAKIFKTYKLSDYNDELAKKNHSKSSMQYFENTAKEILGDFMEPLNKERFFF